MCLHQLLVAASVGAHRGREQVIGAVGQWLGGRFHYFFKFFSFPSRFLLLLLTLFPDNNGLATSKPLVVLLSSLPG
jgi:hypothetical protein